MLQCNKYVILFALYTVGGDKNDYSGKTERA